MARPAARSPTGPRLVMSADSLLKSSLQPFIASRSEKSRRSKDNADSTRLSQVHYGHPDTLSTPRNMYDYDTGSTIMAAPRPNVHRNVTQTHSFFDSTPYHRPKRLEESTLAPSIIIPYHQTSIYHPGMVQPYNSNSPQGHPNPAVLNNVPERRHYHYRVKPYRRRRRRRRRRKSDSLQPPCCYVFLKFVELMLCITTLVLTRVWNSHFSLDFVYTTFAAVGILACGLGLIILWTKGHPSPGHWLHIAMLLIYAITIPMLLCGGMMLLLISSLNVYGYIVVGLFFFSATLFVVDVVIMTFGILQCGCCCYQPLPRHRRTHPDRRHYDDDYHRHHHPHHRHHHHSYPPEDPGYYSDGSYPIYPRSVPQMSMRTRREDW